MCLFSLNNHVPIRKLHLLRISKKGTSHHNTPRIGCLTTSFRIARQHLVQRLRSHLLINFGAFETLLIGKIICSSKLYSFRRKIVPRILNSDSETTL